MSDRLTKRELVNAIIAKIKADAPKFSPIPVGNFDDGITKGFDMSKVVGVHFGGGQQVGQYGNPRRSWRINIYVYHLSWNKSDKLLGVADDDGILEETKVIERLLDGYIFPTELPGHICFANLSEFLPTGAVAIAVETKKEKIKNRYLAWGGFGMIYQLED